MAKDQRIFQSRRMSRRYVLILVYTVCAAFLASCAGGTAAKKADKPPAHISVTPAENTQKVAVTKPVEVSATDGQLNDVTVTDAKGKNLKGALNSDRTKWLSRGDLAFGATYTVHAKAANSKGKTTESTSSFTTVKPQREAAVEMSPQQGTTVGVGMPLRIYFNDSKADKPISVTNKKEILKNIKITTTPKQDLGAQFFNNNSELHFRPQKYWKAHTKVAVNLNLRGVELAKGTYANSNRTIKFSTGASHISKADGQSHRMVTYSDGKVVKDMPVSLGAEVPGRMTSSGPHVVTERNRWEEMDSSTFGLTGAGSYRLMVEWATRISNNGEFVHSAPWSVADQGVRNVSHGCINASPADAEWFQKFSQIGDVVEITGTGKKLSTADGDIYDWTVPWNKWNRMP